MAMAKSTNDEITVRLTGSQTQELFTLVEDYMKPAFNLALHLHRKHRETFHVLDGEVQLRLGSQTYVGKAGTTVYVPSNVPHAVRIVNGRPVRMLMFSSPAGFEKMLEQMERFTDAQFADPQFMNEFNEKHNTIVLE